MFQPLEVEKQQEQKLLARHPGLGNKPGGSKFLQKRLSKGVSMSSVLM